MNNLAVEYTEGVIKFESGEDTDSVYVFCPEEQVSFIHNVLKEAGITHVINDTNLSHFFGLNVCHYKSSLLNDEVKALLVKATKYGSKVQPLVSFFDEKKKYSAIELMTDNYFIHQRAFGILQSKKAALMKRAIDLLCVMILSPIALILGVFTAIAIKLESPGPIFFKQRRTGRYNIEFDVIKFRSMGVNAEANGAQWATKNDMRVTRVGKFIRKTRIDELPQLINVFRGEMSMVGPRPEREVFITDLEKHIPYYRFRHAVQPGVTGLAQVSYPYGSSIEDAEWKHRFDIYYIKNHDLKMDLKVLIKTFKVVLFGMGQ